MSYLDSTGLSYFWANIKELFVLQDSEATESDIQNIFDSSEVTE